MAGEFDLITNLLPEFTKQVPKSVHILGLEHPILILNSDKGATKDVRVRQASTDELDRRPVVLLSVRVGDQLRQITVSDQTRTSHIT